MNAALLIIGLTMAGALALGLRAARGREMTLELAFVDGLHLRQQLLASRRELRLEASPVRATGDPLETARVLEAVNELGDAAAAQGQPLRELAHARPAGGTVTDR